MKLRNPQQVAKRLQRAVEMERHFLNSGEDQRAAEQHERALHLDRVLKDAVRCRRCGRTLTDPQSVKQGFGSDCLQMIQRGDWK